MSINEALPCAEGILNILTTLVLFLGRRAVRNRKIHRHKALMRLALGLGAAFLVVFFLRQGLVPPRTVSGPGLKRSAYLLLLMIHLPAVTILPFVAIPTIWLALKENFERHRKWARVLYPLWMTSNITGVLALAMVFGWGTAANG